MKYVSCDIETTGLDPDKDQIIEIGAIIEDPLDQKNFDDIPKFHAILKHDRYSGTAYAIGMNVRIFEILFNYEKIKDSDEKIAYAQRFNIVSPNDISRRFLMFLCENGINVDNVICAGKNFASFDRRFLDKLPYWGDYFRVSHRNIDPAIYYTNFYSDNKIAGLETCLERAGLEPNVTHDAIQDSWDVIRVIRPHYDRTDEFLSN